MYTLHCSLQTRTKRMFIQGSEENNPNNVWVLGLQLDNYVTDATPLRNGWGSGVVKNAAKMRSLFTEYILRPLVTNAEDEQHPPHAPADAGAAGPQQPQQLHAGAPGGGWLGQWAWLVGAGAAPPPVRQAAQRRQLMAALGVAAAAVAAVAVARQLRQRGA
ncbi:hypothetical protein GPECTOR_34g685 [Gonium pectorale]|uniref:Uncharacterized protein n=1 Tax=Gonium pectorale TaxID=33097 RepID=A0A150GCF3_GONPE|nr:hypothetical protein GPECTOR_34g685 [Gonium pectorale]|eukprot:KXZ47526.1 hypothetical protein GPECTOR_34g685 [Gonium pectorale]